MISRMQSGAAQNTDAHREQDKRELLISKTYGRAVFIHSSFRTSSTWLWNAFRRLDKTCCYYEVFHESLASLRVEDIPNLSYDTWNSRHPVSEPYFREFAELCRANGGVQNFVPEMAFDTFIPSDGLDGSLTANEKVYISGLINHSLRAEQKPVLTCCRTVGRLGAIKREFGGWNVFLYRNLFYQWMSYLAQHYQGNSYFLHTIFRILESNSHDLFFSRLRARCAAGNPGVFGGFHDIGSAFEAFVGVHLYLSMKAHVEADQVIEVDRLADDQNYVGATQLTLIRQTGLHVNLSDAKRSVERFGNEPYVPEHLQDLVLRILDEAAASLGYEVESSALEFGSKLASDLLLAEREHRIHTSGLSKQLRDEVAKNHTIEAELSRLNLLIAEMEKNMGSIAAQLYILEPPTKTITWRLLRRLHPAWPRSLK